MRFEIFITEVTVFKSKEEWTKVYREKGVMYLFCKLEGIAFTKLPLARTIQCHWGWKKGSININRINIS